MHNKYCTCDLCPLATVPTEHILLSFVVSATAFYKSQSVLEFLHEMLDMERDTIRRPLADSQRLRFAKEIKGLLKKLKLVLC